MTVRTTTKKKVLVVGGGTTLGYHILDQLKDKFDCRAIYIPGGTNWDTAQPWTRVAIGFLDIQVLTACLSGLLAPGGYDWVVLSPEVHKDKRTTVANCFLDALQTASHTGNVIMLSHDGANESALSDRRIQLAELYTIENKIQEMTYLKRVYILRVAMLQEQLFYAALHSIKSSLVLPVDLHFLNPISTLDVVHSIEALIAGTSTAFAKRTHSVSHLTGPGTCARQRHHDVIIHGVPTQFCFDPDGSYGKRYKDWSSRVKYSISLPYWPTGGEIATVREYLGYVGRSLEPAKTSSDWDKICPGKQRQSLAHLLDVIHEHLGLLET